MRIIEKNEILKELRDNPKLMKSIIESIYDKENVDSIISIEDKISDNDHINVKYIYNKNHPCSATIEWWKIFQYLYSDAVNALKTGGKE